MEISQNESSISLELVNPWELPLSQSLPSAERLCLDQALQQLLQALENPSLQEALCCIEQALKELGTLDSRPASIDSTKTALQAWEVEDYDHYFQICHVDTEQPLFCVVRGLLVTCQRFVEICLKIPCLDVQQVEQQNKDSSVIPSCSGELLIQVNCDSSLSNWMNSRGPKFTPFTDSSINSATNGMID